MKDIPPKEKTMTEKEQALLTEITAMTADEFSEWMFTPRPFDPEVNTAKVVLASGRTSKRRD